MKTESKLARIMGIEDEKRRMSKLFGYLMETMSHCEPWEEAKAEFERLWRKGVRMV